MDVSTQSEKKAYALKIEEEKKAQDEEQMKMKKL